jgi:hypothetical protein
LDFENHLPTLAVEAKADSGSQLGGAIHPLLPPEVAPPDLALGLRRFLADHPFETNVFGMTRFPSVGDEVDPVRSALEIARSVISLHGLEFHMASDRAIVDDLWANVTAHMWGAKFGIAFFEDRRGRGINHNMMIEVGALLMTGRRCALLRDRSVEAMPTDLVGKIYKPVDLDDASSVEDALHTWLRDDIGVGVCDRCPSDLAGSSGT